jgi:coenzyme F420-reducing hydrogenase beta subunit
VIFVKTYFGYSLIEPIRANAASGGMVSTLIIDGLRQKRFDGALLCRSFVVNNEVKTEYFIATSEEEIAQTQGSKYIATRFSSEAVSLIREFKGKIAVVCLPCEALILNNLRGKDQELNQKLALVITLYCGHDSEKGLTEMVLRKLNPKNKPIQDFRFRFGHWRGNLKLTLTDGEEIVKPFHYFSDYQNLFFFCETKCLQCVDQTGFYADISVGDIWSMEMKDNPIKHNALIVRTEAGQKAVESVQASGIANVFEVPVGRVCAGQSRSLPLHANVNARAWAGKRYGLNLKPNSDAKLTMLEKMTARILLFNYWLSRQKNGPKDHCLLAAICGQAISVFLQGFTGAAETQTHLSHHRHHRWDGHRQPRSGIDAGHHNRLS